MASLDKNIEGFLARHRISVFTTLQPDGSVHSATCHFAHSDNPLQLIFLTENSTRKCLGLLEGKSANASVVVGFSEEEWIELQLTGMAKISTADEFNKAKTTYEQKFKTTLSLDPEDVLIVFTPNWYRYTEFKRDPLIKIEQTL